MHVTIRKAIIDDAQSIAEVRTSSWQSTYSGIVSDSYLNSMDTTANAELWRRIIAQNPFVLVAETDKIVGFASGGQNRTAGISADGEIYALYLLKEYQGIGIGKMLFNEFVKLLSALSAKSILIWVLKDNPSKHFYTRMGGKLIKEAEIEIGNQKLMEEAYIWNNI